MLRAAQEAEQSSKSAGYRSERKRFTRYACINRTRPPRCVGEAYVPISQPLFSNTTLYYYTPQATGSNLPSNRHTPIKNIPKHSTGYRQHSPRQPTQPCKKHTDTFQRLPTAISQAVGGLWAVCSVGEFAREAVALRSPILYHPPPFHTFCNSREHAFLKLLEKCRQSCK